MSTNSSNADNIYELELDIPTGQLPPPKNQSISVNNDIAINLHHSEPTIEELPGIKPNLTRSGTFQTVELHKPSNLLDKFKQMQDQIQSKSKKTTNLSKFLKKSCLTIFRHRVDKKTHKTNKYKRYLSRFEEIRSRRNQLRLYNRRVLKQLLIGDNNIDDNDILILKEEANCDFMNHLLMNTAALVINTETHELNQLTYMKQSKIYGWRMNNPELLNSLK